jgi:hypothetical protein
MCKSQFRNIGISYFLKRSMIKQGNMIPPNDRNPARMDSNESEVDEIPSREFKK